MSSRSNSLLSKIGGLAVRGFQPAFQRRDIAGAERLGEKLANLWFRADKKHRDRAISNLLLAFPEKTPEQAADLAKESFRHFGRVMGDFMRSPIRTDEEVMASIEHRDLGPYLRALQRDKGVLAITGHMGNFERFAHWFQAQGYNISVVARDANDEGLQQQVAQIRGGRGVGMMSRGNSARAILQKIRNKETVGILPDQNADECFVPFFGKPCGTTLGPAVLHLRTGAPLVPAYCLRTGPGTYRVEIFEPMEYERGKTTPEQIMADLNAVLEDVIRRYPEQWLWLHDRWKSARRAGML